MRKFFIFYFVLFHFSLNGFAEFIPQLKEISEIYIEASGNNKFEARIKAHELGMNRALSIIADKENIPSGSIGHVPYYKLKQLFHTYSTTNELETEESYNAMVSYKYYPNNFNKLLLEFGDHNVQEKFYEYLILPVLKQRNYLNIWEENNIWNSKWFKARTNLDKHKLFLPSASRNYVNKISPETIFALNFDQIQEIFKTIFFKKALIIVNELFTDFSTGNSSMKIQYIIIEQNRANLFFTKEYSIDALEEIPSIVQKIIDETIHVYGHKLVEYASPKEQVLLPATLPPRSVVPVDDTKIFQLNVEVFNDGELGEIEAKLKKVKEIDHYLIKHDYGGKYKINIWTKFDEYALAEGFYINGLSFKIYGNLYNLIDIKEGG